MKIAGSNKINGNCPSKMKVYEDIDSKCVTKWAEGLKKGEDSPVVLFKCQNIFDEDLYPVMKVEEFDSTSLTLAFAAIKEQTRISQVLMMDNTESVFNAWKTVLVFLRKDCCAHGMWIEVGDVVFPG
ncbi:hypothetical protein TNIN_34251 [Trichonephila inaurata madagascariensis]|uniref:Uncharacterized protein n=1 Tax=Trichonephila inaurata madagascariensis TaxID=2747483 RepID=A0A8X6WRQ3_9ARAC|nr:hypothetical protein TNIN_34251 [Trichonephila inaurata madagascariensis]